MSFLEQLKAVAILVPVVLLLATGVGLTAMSRNVAGNGTLTLRGVVSNVTRALFLSIVSLAVLMALQQLVGYRHP